MPTTKPKPKPKPKPAARSTPRKRQAGGTNRTTDLSDEVLKAVEKGQRAAIEAVRDFVDTVDRTLPHGEQPSKRQEIVDAAMDMADRLVHTQYDFLRNVVQSAGRSLTRSDAKK